MIIHTGEALIDFIPVTLETGETAFLPAPGGSPYNTSIATARLGVPVAFLGRISRDFFGDQLVGVLEENNVDTGMITRSDALSTLAFVSKSREGEVRYAFFANGAADRGLVPDDIPSAPTAVTAFQFGSISLIPDPVGATIISFMERMRDEAVISFDPNIRDSLIEDPDKHRSRIDRAIAASTIVKTSDEDLRWMIGEREPEKAAQILLDRGPFMVVVTEGAKGASVFTRNARASAAARPTTVSDTIGAGDSFHAAVLAWLYHADALSREKIASLTVEKLEKMLNFAGAVAAHTCSRAGADPPRLSDVERELII